RKESARMERSHMAFVASRFLASVSTVALILVLPVSSQTPVSDGTLIPGVVEPLELRGEAQGLVELSELQRRLGDAAPKGNDPQELKRAKEAVNAIIQLYPHSAEALSTRLLFSCDEAKAASLNTADINEVLRLQKSASGESTELVLLSESDLLKMRAKIEF